MYDLSACLDSSDLAFAEFQAANFPWGVNLRLHRRVTVCRDGYGQDFPPRTAFARGTGPSGGPSDVSGYRALRRIQVFSGKNFTLRFFLRGAQRSIILPIGSLAALAGILCRPQRLDKACDVRELIDGLEAHRVRFVLWQLMLDDVPEYTAGGGNSSPFAPICVSIITWPKFFPAVMTNFGREMTATFSALRR